MMDPFSVLAALSSLALRVCAYIFLRYVGCWLLVAIFPHALALSRPSAAKAVRQNIARHIRRGLAIKRFPGNHLCVERAAC